MPAHQYLGLHNRQHRPPIDEAGKYDEGQAGGVGGASGRRLAFNVQGQLFAEKEVFGRELPMGVQSGPDELKGIEQHFDTVAAITAG